MWLLILIRQFKAQIEKVLAVLTYDSIRGVILDPDGVEITGIASYTWAQFAAFTAGEKTALAGIPIHITDVHTNASGIGGSYVRYSSSPAGWSQISGPMYYATFDLVPAAGSYPGWRYRVGSGIGIGGADIYDTGTRLRYVNGSALVSCIYSDILHTTDFSVEKIAKTYALPINNGKSIMQNGDYLELCTVIGRPTLTTAIVTRALRFGTGNTVSDTLLESINVITVGNKTSGEFSKLQRRSATALTVVGGATLSKWGAITSQAQVADKTVSDMDAAISYLHYTIDQDANTDEAVALKHFYLNLVHGGA